MNAYQSTQLGFITVSTVSLLLVSANIPEEYTGTPMMDLLIGPVGALVFAILVTYALWKLVLRMGKKQEQLNQELIKAKDKEIAFLKKQLEKYQNKG